MPTSDPVFLHVKSGMTVIVTDTDGVWRMADVIWVDGGARNSKTRRCFRWLMSTPALSIGSTPISSLTSFQGSEHQLWKARAREPAFLLPSCDASSGGRFALLDVATQSFNSALTPTSDAEAICATSRRGR